jgi:hypothetical protein
MNKIDIKVFKKELKQKLQELKTNENYETGIDALIQYIDNTNPQITTKSMQVCAIDVKGIMYFADAFQNVYRTEDVLNEVDNPRIIGKTVSRESTLSSK